MSATPGGPPAGPVLSDSSVPRRDVRVAANVMDDEAHACATTGPRRPSPDTVVFRQARPQHAATRLRRARLPAGEDRPISARRPSQFELEGAFQTTSATPPTTIAVTDDEAAGPADIMQLKLPRGAPTASHRPGQSRLGSFVNGHGSTQCAGAGQHDPIGSTEMRDQVRG